MILQTNGAKHDAAKPVRQVSMTENYRSGYALKGGVIKWNSAILIIQQAMRCNGIYRQNRLMHMQRTCLFSKYEVLKH